MKSKRAVEGPSAPGGDDEGGEQKVETTNCDHGRRSGKPRSPAAPMDHGNDRAANEDELPSERIEIPGARRLRGDEIRQIHLEEVDSCPNGRGDAERRNDARAQPQVDQRENSDQGEIERQNIEIGGKRFQSYPADDAADSVPQERAHDARLEFEMHGP